MAKWLELAELYDLNREDLLTLRLSSRPLPLTINLSNAQSLNMNYWIEIIVLMEFRLLNMSQFLGKSINFIGEMKEEWKVHPFGFGQSS